MKLKKVNLLIVGMWLLVTGSFAHASYLCTVNCVYAGSVVASNDVDAIVLGNPLTNVLGDPGDPPNTGLGVVLAQRVGSCFATPTANSTLTVQMATGISGDGMLWVIGDEEFPGTENETFKVFVSATNVFDASTSDLSKFLGTFNNNASIDLSAFLTLPTTLNYVKLQAFPSPFGPSPAPMAVLGIAGQSVSQVPVPAAVWLFGSGLIGLLGIARRRNLP